MEDGTRGYGFDQRMRDIKAGHTESLSQIESRYVRIVRRKTASSILCFATHVTILGSAIGTAPPWYGAHALFHKLGETCSTKVFVAPEGRTSLFTPSTSYVNGYVGIYLEKPYTVKSCLRGSLIIASAQLLLIVHVSVVTKRVSIIHLTTSPHRKTIVNFPIQAPSMILPSNPSSSFAFLSLTGISMYSPSASLPFEWNNSIC